MHSLGLRKSSAIPVGRVVRGHLKGVKPVSTSFGFDRDGGPIDRFYIESFLEKNASSIKGRVMEIEDNEYTLRFGSATVQQSDILHVNGSNPKATFVGDLSHAPHIPDNIFDCIILTQTLHLIYDFQAAINTCFRLLKPGGVLLFTSPGITPIDHGEWKEIWYWSFTEASVKKMMQNVFPAANVAVNTHGNVAVATAFLYGLSLNDVTKEELQHVDPYYPVIITAKSVKPHV